MNLAGRPSRLGGTIARVVGWAVLLGGISMAVVLGALAQAIWPAGIVGWVLGSGIGLVSATAGLLLLIGGARLHKAGSDRELDMRLAAVRAIASRNQGVVTPEGIASALGMTVPAADAMLTDLVKKGDEVRLEVDDDGRLLYLFGGAMPRVRVAPVAPGPPDRIAVPAARDRITVPAPPDRSAEDRLDEEELDARREERARR